MDAPEKDSPPSHEMLCLGIWINTSDMTLSVPAYRVEELQLKLVNQMFFYPARASTAPWKTVLCFHVRSARQGLYESSLKCSSAPRRTGIQTSTLRGSSRGHKLRAVLSLAVE